MQLLPERAEVRALIQLAIPIVSVQVGMMLMGVVDTIMVGHISAAALAAVALGNLFYFAIAIFGMGVLYALDPVISQAVGAGDQPAISRAVQRGFIIAVGITAILSVIFFLTRPILEGLHQPPDVIPLAVNYVYVVAPSILPLLAFIVLRQTLQSMGRIRPIIWTIVGANLMNWFFNWVFIYGKFGAPKLGVVGSALATTLSRFAMFFALLLLGWSLLQPHLQLRRDSFAMKPIGRMLKLGLPIGIGQFFEYANFGGIAILMGLLGMNEMAAHQVAINIASFTFMVPAGVASAAAVLVGNAIGRGDPDGARRAAKASLAVGAGFMVMSAALMVVIPHQLAGVYTNDAGVLAIAVVLLPIAGLFQVFDGVQVVGAGVLRGTGDTRVPMLIALAGFWIVGMPISVYFGLYTPAGAAGLWWGFVAGLAAVAIFLLFRIKHRFSGELTRIIMDDHHHAVPPVMAGDV
ncbi:MAG TPA: MATE family efflux transporter [Longimicrobiales bacterium]|nr:MATE family efflux transporter [Longimicrobiales bacterium]